MDMDLVGLTDFDTIDELLYFDKDLKAFVWTNQHIDSAEKYQICQCRFRMLDVNWVSIPLLCQLILPPCLRSRVAFFVSFSKATERKGNRRLGWFRSLLFFWYPFVFQKSFPSTKEEAIWRVHSDWYFWVFCLVICRFVSAEKTCFFCCRSSCC